jgi:hypothetical protein
MSDGFQEGWGFPGSGRKAHYFKPDGRSLCGRWGFFGGRTEPDDGPSPDDCVGCRRELDKRAGSAREEQGT